MMVDQRQASMESLGGKYTKNKTTADLPLFLLLMDRGHQGGTDSGLKTKKSLGGHGAERGLKSSLVVTDEIIVCGLNPSALLLLRSQFAFQRI